MSPIDGISLTFLQKYLKKSQIKNKNFFCIPLCDVCNKAIVVYVDSLYEIMITRKQPQFGTVLLDGENINLDSYLKRRVQLDSISCDV